MINDAQCDVHGVQWSSRERGGRCPACDAENNVYMVFRAGMYGIGFVAAGNDAARLRKAIKILQDAYAKAARVLEYRA